MEILDNYITEREGNDCLITEAITLICITDRAYVVTYIRDILGGWINNPIEANSRSFHSYDEAKMCYNKSYEQIKSEF